MGKKRHRSQPENIQTKFQNMTRWKSLIII